MSAQPTVGLVSELCRVLDAALVTYCHWKSNDVLERSATAENDLDLLVRRSDADTFQAVAATLGFKQADAPPGKRMPGVQDYYGFDAEADKIVHVHAHFQLIAGHDMTKNYLLPIEMAYLNTVSQDGLFPIPSLPFEYVAFVLRMVLKHSTWDAMVIKHGQLTAGDRRELAYLEARVEQSEVLQLVSDHLPFVGSHLFERCVRAIQPDSPVWFRIGTGHQLQAALKAYSRRNRLLDTSLKWSRRLKWGAQRRLFDYRAGRRLSAGGAIIAIVGGDGAGKTTIVGELFPWLAKDFEAIQIHMGKPARSKTTTAVRAVLAPGRVAGFYPYLNPSIRYSPDFDAQEFRGKYPWMLRQVCKARDRYLTYSRAKRVAMNGGVVVSDRYPLDNIQLMDGPVLGQVIHRQDAGRLDRFLIGLEESFYDRIGPPDVLIVIRVDPDEAVRRKTDEDPFEVRLRSTEVWEQDWLDTPAHVVDGHRASADVLSELKSLVWSEL